MSDNGGEYDWDFVSDEEDDDGRASVLSGQASLSSSSLRAPETRGSRPPKSSGSSSKSVSKGKTERPSNSGKLPPIPKFDGDLEKDSGAFDKFLISWELYKRRTNGRLTAGEQAVTLIQEGLTGQAWTTIRPHLGQKGEKIDQFDRDEGPVRIVKLLSRFNRPNSHNTSEAIDNYEEFQRFPGEPVYSVINRLEDVEADLAARGIESYPQEHRAKKLLKILQLPMPVETSVLSSIGNEYHYEKLKNALRVHYYPKQKPLPDNNAQLRPVHIPKSGKPFVRRAPPRAVPVNKMRQGARTFKAYITTNDVMEALWKLCVGWMRKESFW